MGLKLKFYRARILKVLIKFKPRQEKCYKIQTMTKNYVEKLIFRQKSH